VLSPTAATLRLFLHVLAATVWVGGQLTLAGLVPGLRALSPDAPRTVARRFNRIAWPAFAVLVITGLWNIVAIDVADTSTDYQATLFLHVSIVAVSGVSAAAHAAARTKVVLAVGGALTALSALGALFLGVLLRSG
jgi:putative copper export protein